MFLAPPGNRILLHVCCAPCSGAIIEALCSQGLEPAVFWSNSNIFPAEENDRRLAVLLPYARKFGVPVTVDAYDHALWLDFVRNQLLSDKTGNGSGGCGPGAAPDPLEGPERGARCLMCFRYRLLRAARYAASNGFDCLATSLASSRWKSLAQVDAAGKWAVQKANAEAGEGRPELIWWPRNWRKGGLQPRREEIIREEGFYNQTFCGCEYSTTTNNQSICQKQY